MAKFQEVEECISFLVKSSGIYDLSKEGYVIERITESDEEENHAMMAVGTSKRPIMILREQIVDHEAVIVNPFNENVAESNDSRWFYTLLSVSLTRRVIGVFKHLRLVLEMGDEPNFEVSTEMVKFASKYKDFNENDLKYLETISKEKLDFLHVWYNRKTKRSYFRCGVYEKDFWEKFPNVTKKARKIITDIVSEIFGLDSDPEKALTELEQFITPSELLTIPRLDATLKVYMKIYSRINQFLDMCKIDDDYFVIDITTLGHHISKLEEYYEKTRWFAHQSPAKNNEPKAATSQNIPTSSQPSPDGYIPDNPNRQGNMMNQPGFGPPIQQDDCGIPDNPYRQQGMSGQFAPNPGMNMNQHNHMMGGGMIPTQPQQMMGGMNLNMNNCNPGGCIPTW